MDYFKNIIDIHYNKNANEPTLQLGEKGNAEYAINRDDMYEHIVQIYFQLTRKNESDSTLNIEVEFKSLLSKIFVNKETLNFYRHELELVYAMTAQTRDIKDGKGERDLFYTLVYVWNMFNFDLAKYLIESCVKDFYIGCHEKYRALGSWADLKKMANFIKNKQSDNKEYSVTRDKLILYIIKLYSDQLVDDYRLFKSGHHSKKVHISLCAKWIPKESQNKYRWLAKMIAEYISNEIGLINNDGELYISPEDKAASLFDSASHLASYKRIHTPINKYLETVQINMCEGTWKDINFKKSLTGQTGVKFRNAILNKDKKGYVRHEYNEDRIKCAENYREYLDGIDKGEIKAKVGAVGITDIVKKVFDILLRTTNTIISYSTYGKRFENERVINKYVQNIYNDNNKVELTALENEWNQKVLDFMYDNSDNSDENEVERKKKVINMIPLIDTSGSMEGFPMMAAISLGIFISEISSFSNRALTFETKPRWIKFEDNWGFIEKVARLFWSFRSGEWGGTTNFKEALMMMLEVAKENNVPPETMKGMTLAIFSDMQIDQGDNVCRNESSRETMFEFIKNEYQKAGYEAPHILFWNLRQTNGTPNLSSTQNTSMMSGASENLVKFFLEKGVESLKKYTPYEQFVEQMSEPQYRRFIDMLDKTLYQ